MVRISFLYPNTQGKKFDYAYYTDRHMPLVQKRLGEMGLLWYEIDKASASDAPFVAACHLYFNSADAFRKAVALHGAELMGDIPNYTDIEAQMQVSEIVASSRAA